MIKWHLTTYQVSQNCFSRNDFHYHLHYYKSNFVTWYIHWFLHINICVVTKQMRDKQMAHQSVCVHPWILKINQVEETVLILVCIFVIKMNTYWLKRWWVWNACKAFNNYCFSKIAPVNYSILTSCMWSEKTIWRLEILLKTIVAA